MISHLVKTTFFFVHEEFFREAKNKQFPVGMACALAEFPCFFPPGVGRLEFLRKGNMYFLTLKCIVSNKQKKTAREFNTFFPSCRYKVDGYTCRATERKPIAAGVRVRVAHLCLENPWKN